MREQTDMQKIKMVANLLLMLEIYQTVKGLINLVFSPDRYTLIQSISFGLVYIPVTLYNSIKQNDIGFNMIDKKTMSRVRYKKTCEDCENREVRQEVIVKGFEYEDGKYVIFEEKDFEKIKTKKDKNITIERSSILPRSIRFISINPTTSYQRVRKRRMRYCLRQWNSRGKRRSQKRCWGQRKRL